MLSIYSLSFICIFVTSYIFIILMSPYISHSMINVLLI